MYSRVDQAKEKASVPWYARCGFNGPSLNRTKAIGTHGGGLKHSNIRETKAYQPIQRRTDWVLDIARTYTVDIFQLSGTINKPPPNQSQAS